MTARNREAWLTAAVKPLTKIIARSELKLDREVAVSCGWPGGKSVNKVIGQCWPTGLCNGKAQLFVSPRLHEPTAVLTTLLHELLHAADDCKSGHKGAFAKAHKVIGLGNKPTTSSGLSDDLKAELAAIAAKLGPYPHAPITPGARIAPVQSTRMIKLECPECGYVVRTTRKWLDVCNPICANNAEHTSTFENVYLAEA